MLRYCADKDIVYDTDAIRQPKEGPAFRTCEETLTAKGVSAEAAKELCGNLNKEKVGGGPPRDLTLSGPSTSHSKPNSPSRDSVLMLYDAESDSVIIATDDAFAEAPAGSGERFAACKRKMAEKGAKDPAALCASIGRKKYGKEKFQQMAAAGKKG